MPTHILSWNVNGLRAAVKKGFLDWFEKVQPDILCLQETRVLPDELEAAVREPKGYTTLWMPAQKRGYSGVATFVKGEALDHRNLGQDEFDSEGRVQLVEFSDFTVVNCYFPNSQPERKRIDYKLKFCDALRKRCNKLVKTGTNVILCGDYNIAHTEIDLARPKANEDNPGYYIEEREAMTQFLEAGYVDTFRHFCGEPGHYSWWSYRSGARAKNIGWRLDYHCVNTGFIERVQSAEILDGVMGSDHCPVGITIQ